MTATQSFEEASSLWAEWLASEVEAEGRGSCFERLEVAPESSFWLGRINTEESVLESKFGARGERLDPCAIGLRVRPEGVGPWSFSVGVSMRLWLYDLDGSDAKPWLRSRDVTETIEVVVDSDGEGSFGADRLSAALAAAGGPGMCAEVRTELDRRPSGPELVVLLVNTSSKSGTALRDVNLYETRLQLSGLDTIPFELEALPDSFRHDRRVAAYGMNVGVETDGRTFTTTDCSTVDTQRPVYWNSDDSQPDLRFHTLAADPLPPLEALLDALEGWNDAHWSDDTLARRARAETWSDEMSSQAASARADVDAESARLRRGLDILRHDEQVRRAFQLMNRAIELSSRGRGYDAWRPFQVGFLLGSIAFLVDRDAEAAVVDTVWFATGGGKTETYLGLLVTTALYDRMRGKTTGVSAWSRFPLRLLSLQQTQRFADALAGAELVRRREKLGGAPLSLGFLVGGGGTPNRVLKEAAERDPDPDSPGMPDDYQVLMSCPFCGSDEIEMRFDRRAWQLTHACTSSECPWPNRYLPIYIVDQEIFRFLPTVVLGTLDKAASISFQIGMRGLVGPPLGVCSEAGHGYVYAPRADKPHGCLVPDCKGDRAALPQATDLYGPSLHLQDELHLLRDSLGAVDSHYESLLDDLQKVLGAPRVKVVASSATLVGHDHQVGALYQRRGRVFPMPGPSVGESFWSTRSSGRLRRFVAVAPRGVTLEHVTDRTTNVLQTRTRALLDSPGRVCRAAGIDERFADRLIDLYGTDVLYGTTTYDVEAAERSMNTNLEVPVNSVQLTGQTGFDEVRATLDRLENPETEFDERIHVVAASSMLSHGVDVARLNVMIMMGLPLSTAEFIQTTARVGRRHPALVFVLHKIVRERDAQVFRQFPMYVTHGDRFIDPVPVSRRSRRVLRRTLPGVVEARRLMLLEPKSAGQRLTTLKALREFAKDHDLNVEDELRAIVRLLGFEGPADGLLRDEIRQWLEQWFADLSDEALSIKWPSELGPDTPMISLRDVEERAPIREQLQGRR